MPALRIIHPTTGETTHLLRGPRVTVGRAADNTIQISHASISNHHAEFVSVDGSYRLHDLHSTNRSYVEGRPVTECDLAQACKILFGSVECEFVPTPPPTEKRLELPRSAAVPPADPGFLERENYELRARLHSLQRRFDILGSARLAIGKTDLTPLAAADDATKALQTERNDLRQQTMGLRLEAERLRVELAVTIRERDAARQAAEALQTERATLTLELKRAQARALLAMPPPASPPPLRPPTVAPLAPPRPPASTAPIAQPTPPPVPAVLPEPAPDVDQLPDNVRTLCEAIAQLSAAPAELPLLGRVQEAVAGIAINASPLGAHPFRRIIQLMGEFAREIGGTGQPPAPGVLRTLRQGGELLSRLLEPRLFAAGRDLAPAQVLVIDDDADLLAAVTTALTSAELEVTGCRSAEEALDTIRARRFDAIVADFRLPEMNGAAFCTRARELPAYRRTPVLFLTVADTLDKRAETSLSGGNEFIAKPFNVFELALKVQGWALRHQLQPLS